LRPDYLTAATCRFWIITPAFLQRSIDMVGFPSLRAWADKILDLSLPVLITGVTLLVFIQVLLRYIFNAPLMGIEELLIFPTTWLYMCGAIKASSEKTQIVARVLEIFFRRQKIVYLLRAIAAFFAGVVLIWLIRWGWDYFTYVLRVWKESPTLYIPTFWYEGLVFFALAFIFAFTVLEVVEYLKLYRATPQSVLVAKLEEREDA
jgi:TRAP-type C4-dicarboxylate transport system permease small subunit